MITTHRLKTIAVAMMAIFAYGESRSDVIDNNLPSRKEMTTILNHVNKTWQERNPWHGNHFWNRAVYHVGNMEAYDVTNEAQYLEYSTQWAERNNWCGATSNDTLNWSSSYGEGGRYVLFGDNQVCFQVYADLYNLDPTHDKRKIERALGVMGYEIGTDFNEYIWWVDGMFMVMPTMAKLFNITGDTLYLEKMHDYWLYAHQLMFDNEESLYYRDAKYIYPSHTTISGKKDFWARGDGWAFATFARILDEMPADAPYRDEYANYFKLMAKALKDCQQEEGYWTRSLLDPAHAPGKETSGTALNAYAYATGLRLGLINTDEYGETLEKAWGFLSKTAYQADGTVGYIQPIGEKADPNQTLSKNSYYDFGVGAFLMASAAVSRIAPDTPYLEPLKVVGASIDDRCQVSVRFNIEPNADEASSAANYTMDGTPINARSISVSGTSATIIMEDSIEYGVHDICAYNIHSAEGGELGQACEASFVRTVDLDSPQTGISVSAIGSQDGNPFANATDGDLNTRWSQEGYGQWICFDLGEAKSVYAVDMAFYNGDQRKFFFDIQTSTDSTEWRNAATGITSCGMTRQLERFAFDSTLARYVRIVCNGNSQNLWNSPTEIRIRYSDIPTGINTMRHSGTHDIFDLQGRKIPYGTTAKGHVYISNGKKTILSEGK